jgi:hypothetical protein
VARVAQCYNPLALSPSGAISVATVMANGQARRCDSVGACERQGTGLGGLHQKVSARRWQARRPTGGCSSVLLDVALAGFRPSARGLGRNTTMIGEKRVAVTARWASAAVGTGRLSMSGQVGRSGPLRKRRFKIF